MKKHSAALVMALGVAAFAAACSLEVNINLDGSDEAEAAASPEVRVDIPPPPAAVEPPAAPPIVRPLPPTSQPPARRGGMPVAGLLPPPEIPRPGTGSDRELTDGPTFTPFTVAPSILNRSEVIQAMGRWYPAHLREAGLGGTIRVYFLIDETGTVLRTQVDQGSGNDALDAAALAVAGVYRFKAAQNRGEPVPVWVSFPITFQVR